MLKNQTTGAIITGIFFIAATVSAIIGRMLYSPLLNENNYLIEGAKHANMITGGGLAETITCCANIGTAIMLYPLLRKYNESIGIGYVCFRFLEVVFIAIGVISMLTLLTVSNKVMQSDLDISQANTTGQTLKAIYEWSFLLGPNFILGINTILYSFTFYKTRIVPKPLAAWGITGAILIFIAGVLQIFGTIEPLSVTQILMAMPIAIFEMTLAGWLITKGFSTQSINNTLSTKNSLLPPLSFMDKLKSEK